MANRVTKAIRGKLTGRGPMKVQTRYKPGKSKKPKDRGIKLDARHVSHKPAGKGRINLQRTDVNITDARGEKVTRLINLRGH